MIAYLPRRSSFKLICKSMVFFFLFVLTSVALATPITTLTTNPSAPDGDNGWFKTVPSVTLTANETATTTYYSWDGGTYTTYTSPLSAPEGIHTLNYYSIDSLGNTETIDNQAFKVDSQSPSTTLTTNPSAPDGGNGWYTSDVTVTLTATDNAGGSSVALVEYSFDDILWNNYTGSFTFGAEGTTTIYYRSTDSAGNVEATNEQVIKIDKTAPQTDADLTGTEGQNGWYASDVEVALTATDNAGGSGVAALTGSEDTINEDFEDGNADGWTLSGQSFPQIVDSSSASWLIDGDYSLYVRGSYPGRIGHLENNTYDAVAYRDFIVPQESERVKD